MFTRQSSRIASAFRLRPVIRITQLSSQLRFTRTMATSIPKTMKGVLIEKTGGVEVLQYKTDLPVPTPKAGEVLVKNDFIGVNYIDTYLPLSILIYTKILTPSQLFPYGSLPLAQTRNPRPRSRRYNRLHRTFR